MGVVSWPSLKAYLIRLKSNRIVFCLGAVHITVLHFEPAAIQVGETVDEWAIYFENRRVLLTPIILVQSPSRQ